jgi:hypothetical protein
MLAETKGFYQAIFGRLLQTVGFPPIYWLLKVYDVPQPSSFPTRTTLGVLIWGFLVWMASVMEGLKLDLLWKRCRNADPIPLSA